MEVAKTGKPSRVVVHNGLYRPYESQPYPIGNPVLPQAEDNNIVALFLVRGSVETLHHPPAARFSGYGEEKVQTPNSRSADMRFRGRESGSR